MALSFFGFAILSVLVSSTRLSQMYIKPYMHTCMHAYKNTYTHMFINLRIYAPTCSWFFSPAPQTAGTGVVLHFLLRGPAYRTLVVRSTKGRSNLAAPRYALGPLPNGSM